MQINIVLVHCPIKDRGRKTEHLIFAKSFQSMSSLYNYYKERNHFITLPDYSDSKDLVGEINFFLALIIARKTGYNYSVRP